MRRSIAVLGAFALVTALLQVVGAQPAAAAPGLTIYVAPNGTAGAAGTIGAPTTLEGARDMIDALPSLPAGGVAVLLRGGVYPRTAPFTLDKDDSGTASSPISYEAYPGEEPIISGAQSVTGWTALTTTPAGLTAAATGKLLVASIPVGERPHFLYVDGVPQQVARQFNTDEWRTWPKFGTGQVSAPVEPAPNVPHSGGQQLKYAPGILANLPSNGDLEMELWPVRWWNTMSVVRDVNTTTNTVMRHSKSPTNFWPDSFDNGGHGQSNLMNALPFLDLPGEWVVDSAAGKIYYWPPSGSVAGQSVTIPIAYELLRMQGVDGSEDADKQVHHVAIRGITFQYTDRLPEDEWPDEWLKRNGENPDAAIFLQGVRDIVIENNTVRHTGGYAIALDHFAQNVSVLRNELAHLGSGGVQIQGYGPGTKDVNKYNIIERNYIHNVGLVYGHSAGISIWASNHNSIRYNYLADLRYAAVMIAGAPADEINADMPAGMDSYGKHEAMYNIRPEMPAVDETTVKAYLWSGDNLIAKNIIDEFLLGAGDGGALYAWAPGLNNEWRNNLLFKSANGDLLFPIYMDNFTNGQVLDGNVTWSPGSQRITAPTTNTFTNDQIGYPSKPAGYDTLRATIVSEALAAGGIKGLDLAATPVAPRQLVEGEAYAAQAGTSTAAGGSGTVVNGLDTGDWLRYDNVDFGDGRLVTLQASVSVDPAYAGKQIQIRLDSRTSGAVIGTLTTSSTGSWTTYATQNTPIVPVTGVHTVYLVPASTGSGYAGVDWLKFTTDATLRVQAERFKAQAGTFLSAAGTGTVVSGLDGPDFIQLGEVDFGSTGLTSFQASISVDPASAGKQIEIRLDGRTGTLIGTLTTTSTGSWTTYATQSTPITSTTGVHDVFLEPVGSGTGYAGFDWIKFSNDAARTVEAESHSAQSGTFPASAGSGTAVDGLDTADWLQYSAVNFGSEGTTLFQASLGVDAAYAGKKIQIRIDSLTGPIIGTLTTTSTGGWHVYTTQSALIVPTSGVHDVFLTPASTGSGYASVDWFRFL